MLTALYMLFLNIVLINFFLKLFVFTRTRNRRGKIAKISNGTIPNEPNLALKPSCEKPYCSVFWIQKRKLDNFCFTIICFTGCFCLGASLKYWGALGQTVCHRLQLGECNTAKIGGVHKPLIILLGFIKNLGVQGPLPPPVADPLL